jgi:sucrose-6-phosphate hydrolase SacC (GH32 family)
MYLLQSTDSWQRREKHTLEKEEPFNKQGWKTWISICRRLKLGSRTKKSTPTQNVSKISM